MKKIRLTFAVALIVGFTCCLLATISNAQSIAAGIYHSIALCSDQTVTACGYNNYGQVGDATTVNKSTPVQVSGLTGVIAVAAGDSHGMALLSNGTVWTWGWNTYAQLGDGTTVNKSTPVQVSGLTGVIAIAAGAYHSMALLSNGTVWTWGANGNGQLGDGTTVGKSTPVQVSGISTGITIAGADRHSMVLLSNGTVWAWGDNGFGQLGDGTFNQKITPIQVPGITTATAISAEIYHTMAVLSNGTVWTWGYNVYGQLGDGTTVDKTSPVQVPGITTATAVSAGFLHSIALLNNLTVWAWGLNQDGQLGDGTSGNYQITPVQVSGITSATAITTGWSHSMALLSNGTQWVWGNNNYGQLGDGTLNSTSIPVQASFCAALPIELVSFDAKPVNNEIVLTQWITASEVNSDYFTIEKSKEGKDDSNWEYVGTVDGAGNSSTTLNYSLEDESPYQGTSYYRLKQTDFNGDFKYYGPVAVRLEGIDIINLYPNPAIDHIDYSVVASLEDKITISLIDILGRKVVSEIADIKIGENRLRLNISDYPQGMYMIQLSTEAGKYRTQKQFIVK